MRRFLILLPVVLGGCFGPDISLTDGRWRIQDGSIATVSFTLTNQGNRPGQDIDIRCEVLGQSGTVMKAVSNRIYRYIPVNGSIRVNDLFVTWTPANETADISCYPTGAIIG